MKRSIRAYRDSTSSRSSAVPFNCHGSGSLAVRMAHDMLLNGPLVRVLPGHDFQIAPWNISSEPPLPGFHQDHIMPSVEARDDGFGFPVDRLPTYLQEEVLKTRRRHHDQHPGGLRADVL